MIEFQYERAQDVASAIRLFADGQSPRYLGGGTNLVDLMREDIEQPRTLVDVSNLSRDIVLRDDGSLVIGGAARNTGVAADRAVREHFPMLAQAVLAGASGQIRNMATVGGNIMQRTRCQYFYDDAARCNKRERGAGCDAIGGFNRMHAVLGASPQCIAVHPSDMCVALVALDAVVLLAGPQGERQMPLFALHRLPGDTPDVETELREGELITSIEIPPLSSTARSSYVKVRDRASFAFALISVAVVLDLDDDGVIRDVRIALGGVAHKPWRATQAEQALRGNAPDETLFKQAADAELAAAVGFEGNAFKIELAKRVIVSSLGKLAQPVGVRT